MKKITYYIIGIVGLGVAIIGFWIYQKYLVEPEEVYLMFQVEKGTVQEIVKGRGEVVPQKEFDLEFRMEGIVDDIPVVEGQSVSKGDPLMRLETVDYDLELLELQAKLAQAEADVDASYSQLAQANADLETAYSYLAFAQKDVLTESSLLGQAGVNYDIDLANLDNSESQLEAQQVLLDELNQGTREEQMVIYRTEVENAQKNLTNAQTNLENVENKAKEDLELKAEQGIDTLYQTNVVANKVLSQYLQDIIYPIRYPSAYTCDLSFESSDEGNIESTCFDAMDAAETIEDEVEGVSSSLSEDEIIKKLSDVKIQLNILRSFLNQLFNVVDGATFVTGPFVDTVDQALLVTYKGYVTTAQSELETVIDAVTTDKEGLESQVVTNQKNIDTAQSDVTVAENALAIAEANLVLAEAGATPQEILYQQAQVGQADAQLDAQGSEVEKGDIEIDTQGTQLSKAETTVDIKESEVKKYAALVDLQQANVKQAEAQVEIVRAQMEKVNQNIKRSTIFAPANGTVSKIELELQEVFRPGQKAISLIASGYKIQADITELDIGKIQALDGNEVTIELDAFPDLKFDGEIVSIDTKEVVEDDDIYYRVNIYFEGGKVPIRSGMSADLIIAIDAKETKDKNGKKVLKIPELAVLDENDREYVLVLEDDEMIEVDVETGVSDGEYVEILSGLEEGQIIVVAGE